MNDEADRGTSWFPIALAGGLVALVLVAVLLIDGSANDTDPSSPTSPSATTT